MAHYINLTKTILQEMHQRDLREMQRRRLKEDIFLKKNPETKQIFVFSDIEDKRENAKETISLSKEFRKLGLDWDRSLGHWVGDYSKLEAVNDLIRRHNKVRQAVDTLEMIEDFLEGSDEAPSARDEVLKKLNDYMDDLAGATDQASMDSAIERYLTFYKKFYKYSLTNTWLIFLQKPSATHVAGFKKWKEMNRMVNKGAKAIYIYAPITKKVDDNSIDDTSVDFTEIDKAVKTKKQVTGFRMVPVFDISDTTATSSAGEIPDTPQWYSNNDPNEVAQELVSRLKEFAELHDIKITKDIAKGNEQGWSKGGHINLSASSQGVNEASTLVHEIAHELLHWKGKSLFHIDDESNTRDLQEMQAESVAYTVMKYFNLDASHSPTYLALWKANKEKIKKNLDIITKCARYIIDGVDKLK